MSTFDSAFDRIKNAASSAGLDTGGQVADPFERIASAAASAVPGAAPGGAAGEQDIQRIAAQEYENQLILPELPVAARVATFGIQPREIERGMRQQAAQAAQAIATPGLRAKFFESVLDPFLLLTAPAARPVAPYMAQAASAALEPSGSGLGLGDLRTEQIAARGAAEGLAAGQQQGVAGDVGRAIGQTVPQFLGVAGAIATGGAGLPVVAANIASQATLPLASWTGGSLAYFDEMDAKRAQEALEGKELSSYNIDEMQRRATASAVIQTGTEVIGAGVAGKAIGTIGSKLVGSRVGRSAIGALSERGAPLVQRALASKTGQAGAEAFARVSQGTMRIRNGFFGDASRLILTSAAEEGAEELGAAILEAPFTEAPLSKDLTDGIYSAFIGSIAGGAGGGVALGGAVAGRGLKNRRDAFRPENDAEIRLRQLHSDAMKARTNWTEDLDDAQQAEVGVALNSLNGMNQEERGIFLRELSDRRASIRAKVESLLSLRQDLDAALAASKQAQATYEAGAPERAAKETLVSESQAALDRANADYQAARDALAEMELSAEQARPARVARRGRTVVTIDDRKQAVADAQRLVSDAQAALDSATQNAVEAEGLEVAPGQRIDPSQATADIEQQIDDLDAEMRLLVNDNMIASATYNAVSEKVSDMPMEYGQSEPSDILSQVSGASGVQLVETKAPKRGGRVQKEMEALGIRVVWFKPSGGKFGSPAFHSMSSRGVIYMNADADMSQVRSKSYHEMFHDIQMFRPEIAQAYSERVGLAPIYEAGATYAQGRAESAAKGRADAFARIQAAAAAAGIEGVDVEVPSTVSRIGASRLEQEGQAEAFGATAARVGGRGILSPLVKFAARQGLMGRDVAGAMAVIDAVARAAAVEKAAGVKPDATLSPLARTLLWMEDMSVDIPAEIEQASQPDQPAGVSMTRDMETSLHNQISPIWDAQTSTTIQEFEDAHQGGVADLGDETAKDLITLIPSYNSDIAEIRQAIREALGDSFTLYRSMSREQLANWRNGEDVGAMSGTVIEGIARRFTNLAAVQDKDRVVVAVTATPDMIVMRGSQNEAELVFDANEISADTIRVVSEQQAQPAAPKEPEKQPSGVSMARASDADYLAAVERGDMATAQRMVDEAAKEAGYTLRRYHITPATFTTFRTPSEFTDEFGRDALVEEYKGENVMNVFVRLGTTQKLTGKLMALSDNKPALTQWMDENNLDSVTVSSNWGTADDIIIRNPQDIKSADPVTRDESGNVIPLSKRFNTTTPLISYARSSDADYLAAVERGDMETAQKMVDAAARAAGYVIKAFHGSASKPFWVFDPARRGERTGSNSALLGFFASTEQQVAREYQLTESERRQFNEPTNLGGLSLGGGLRGAEDALDRAQSIETSAIRDDEQGGWLAQLTAIDQFGSQYSYDDGFVYDTAVEAENAAETEKDNEISKAQKRVDDALARFQNEEQELRAGRTLHDLWVRLDNPLVYDFEGGTFRDKSYSELVQEAIDGGHDGVIMQNTRDAIDSDTVSDVIVFFKSNQAKLADPVTRDESGNVIPLSKRFNTTTPLISYARSSDADYLAAVERGDMDTAQRMVDEASRAAGYTIRAKHGSTTAGITKFDLTRQRFSRSEGGVGWFTDNEKTARQYADTSSYINVQYVIDALDNAIKSPKSTNGVFFQADNGELIGPFPSYSHSSDNISVFYLPSESGFVPGYYASKLHGAGDPVLIGTTSSEAVAGLRDFITEQSKTGMKSPASISDVVYDSYLKLQNPLVVDMMGKQKMEPWTDLVSTAKKQGNDGIVVRNVIDIPASMFGVFPENIDEFAGTVYGVFDPAQIKLADPVTYDEQGNVIPLSKRFDVSTPLISYAREADEITSLREQVAALQKQIRDVQNVTAAQRVNAMREVRVLERRIVTAERIAEQKTLQATRAKMRVELEKQAAAEDVAAADNRIAKLQTRLDSAKASVQSLKQELASLRRGDKLEERLAEAEEAAQQAIDLSYAIGRRDGLLAGQIQGQRQERRQVRKLSERLAQVEQRLDVAVPALRDARKQIRTDAAAAQRAINFAYGMGLAKGRIQGVMEGRRQVLLRMARREDTLQNQLFNLRRISAERLQRVEDVADAVRTIATDAAQMLPVALRGPLAVRIANAKTLPQANRIAVEAVKLAADAEVKKSLDAVRALRKSLKKRGMTYAVRTQVEALLDQAESGLKTTSGRRLRAAVAPVPGAPRGAAPALVNAVDIFAAVVDSAAKVEQASLMYAMDRQNYLQMRAARIARYDALRKDIITNMSGRPTLAETERADRSATIPFYRSIGRANSDIYTMMLELEGTEAGVLNDLLSSAQAGKGEAALEHATILRQIVPALQSAGYESIDDYALKNGMLGDASTNLRTVVLGGQDVTLPVGTILSLAAMDDETLDLFGTQAGQGVTFAGATSTKTFFPTRQEIESIRANLSAEERGMIDAMKSILETQIRDRVMDAVYAVEGDQPPVVANYWPRVRQAAQKSDASILNATAGNLVRGALTTVGFAQARTGGNQSLVYRDAFQTWERHVQVALDMIHMAQPYRDAATVLTDPAVVRGMDMQFGEGTAERVLSVFSNGVGATARSNPTIIDKLTNNVTGAVLALRPKTLAKVVIGGQLRLASEIPLGYWSKGVARAAVRLRNPSAWDARVEEIHSINGYFSRRHQLHMRSIISGSLSDADRVRVTTAWQSMVDSFRAAGQNLAAAQLTDAFGRFKDASNGANMMIASVVDMLRYMDEQIMLAAVEARLAEVEDEGALTGQDALREASLRAERDFRRTQNASDEFDDSLLSAHNRVKGASGWRIFFPFSSDPVKARNQIRRAYLSGNRRLETAGAIGANMAASTIIGAASIATVGYMVSLISSMLGGGEPGEEEEKEFKDAVSSLPVSVANEIMSSTLGYMGIVLGWVTSAVQYNRAPFTPIAVRPVEQVVREAKSAKPVPERVIAGLLAFSQYAGFPMYGLYQFVRDFFPKPERVRESTAREATPVSPREKLLDRIERRRREIERLRQDGAAVR